MVFRMPAMEYLRFYLERSCVVIPGWGKTKRVRSGCDRWTLTDTQRHVDWLKKNAKLVNGTGELLAVDVDPKNGGSVHALRQRFPDLPATRMVQTVTPHPDGFGTHLIFTLPDDVRLNFKRLGPGIDIPHAVMLPGSVVLCDDGNERTYELISDVEPAPAPLGLIASIDKGEYSGLAIPSDSTLETNEAVEALVRKFADAGPGERNEIFLQVAPPIIRLRGEEGADLLRWAYAGDDDKWLESALRGAMNKYVGTTGPTIAKPSRYLVEALRRTEAEVRYGRWDGAGGPADRKVLLAIVRMCKNRMAMTTVASIRTLALIAGLEPKTVGSATSRLLESGRICVIDKVEDGSPEYALIAPGMTTVVSKGEYISRGSLIDPLSDVWLGDGLGGRHSQVFDLVSVGIRSAKEISTAGGMGYSTAREVLSRLLETGLLKREGKEYSAPPEVLETMTRLTADLGGADRRKKLADRILEERQRPRGDASQASSETVDDDRRRHEDEEMMRQLGII